MEIQKQYAWEANIIEEFGPAAGRRSEMANARGGLDSLFYQRELFVPAGPKTLGPPVPVLTYVIP